MGTHASLPPGAPPLPPLPPIDTRGHQCSSTPPGPPLLRARSWPGGGAIAMAAAEEAPGPSPPRRKGETLCIPVVTGTVAFYLGKKARAVARAAAVGGAEGHARGARKAAPALPPPPPPSQATEDQSHKWTVYFRSARGEDLSWLLQRVTFVLHESFQNPSRDLEFAPYEVTETGWGEFDIIIRLHFHEDVGEPPLELYHRLRLYDESGQSNLKKPVRGVGGVGGRLWGWEGLCPASTPPPCPVTRPCRSRTRRTTRWCCGSPARRCTRVPRRRRRARRLPRRCVGGVGVRVCAADACSRPLPPLTHPNLQLNQFYATFNPDIEYQRIQRARQRVAQITHSVQRQLASGAAEAGMATT